MNAQNVGSLCYWHLSQGTYCPKQSYRWVPTFQLQQLSASHRMTCCQLWGWLDTCALHLHLNGRDLCTGEDMWPKKCHMSSTLKWSKNILYITFSKIYSATFTCLDFKAHVEKMRSANGGLYCSNYIITRQLCAKLLSSFSHIFIKQFGTCTWKMTVCIYLLRTIISHLHVMDSPRCEPSAFLSHRVNFVMHTDL